jgi:hypothetical protein
LRRELVGQLYAVATQTLASKGNDGEVDWQRLRELCNDVVALRRGDHSAARLKIEQARLERDREKTEGDSRVFQALGPESRNARLDLPR